MRTVAGTIVFKRRGAKGFWYRLFSPGEELCEFFFRHDTLLIFDRIEATLLPQRDFLLLADWSLIERSPIAQRPERLTVAAYFAHLIACFTDAGPRECAFVEAARETIAGSHAPDAVPALETRWGTAMGLRTERAEDIEDLIRTHCAAAYRIRRHLAVSGTSSLPTERRTHA